ncbi:hypothetical protein VNO77_36569 [Canavalia gladiata]|uniref:Uncharacterized protein n=1 Tax=Canavalia gladiata TaxID=3824 RepID=A0AAN9KA85_CANGL
MASLAKLFKKIPSLGLFFFVLLSPSYATSRFIHDHLLSTTSNPHQSLAEKLIRSLNLFPKDSINKRKGGDDLSPFVSGKIMEKKFSFLDDSGSSVEDLGHHAGYYSLPHSIGARDLKESASNILFIDQPTGTGFSYSTNDSDIRHDETGVSNDLYDFLQGFAIGNGLTNSGLEFQAHPDFALDKKLITKENYDEITKLVPGCAKAAKTCESQGGHSCVIALNTCQRIFLEILSINDDINKAMCLCYDFSNVEKLLNTPEVKSALCVGKDLNWVSCSTEVYRAMPEDWMKNMAEGIPALLEDGIKFLAYAGEEDLICNWLGNWRWVHVMEWSGQKAFGASGTRSFLVDGKEAGSLNSYGPLSFLKIWPDLCTLFKFHVSNTISSFEIISES